MKYVLLALSCFAVLGCLGSSPNKEVSLSQLSISTERDIYHSNETLKVHVDFSSTESGMGEIRVSGIRNEFDRELIDEKREINIEKGYNGFDFEFRTPSCEECSSLKPGIYAINATVNFGGKTFETDKKITLERQIEVVESAKDVVRII